jgi:hypothetical protein
MKAIELLVAVNEYLIESGYSVTYHGKLPFSEDEHEFVEVTGSEWYGFAYRADGKVKAESELPEEFTPIVSAHRGNSEGYILSIDLSVKVKEHANWNVVSLPFITGKFWSKKVVARLVGDITEFFLTKF